MDRESKKNFTSIVCKSLYDVYFEAKAHEFLQKQ